MPVFRWQRSLSVTEHVDQRWFWWVHKGLRLTSFLEWCEGKPAVCGRTECCPPSPAAPPHICPVLLSLHCTGHHLSCCNNLTQNNVNWRQRDILNAGNVWLWVCGCWACLCFSACLCASSQIPSTNHSPERPNFAAWSTQKVQGPSSWMSLHETSVISESCLN